MTKLKIAKYFSLLIFALAIIVTAVFFYWRGAFGWFTQSTSPRVDAITISTTGYTVDYEVVSTVYELTMWPNDTAILEIESKYEDEQEFCVVFDTAMMSDAAFLTYFSARRDLLRGEYQKYAQIVGEDDPVPLHFDIEEYLAAGGMTNDTLVSQAMARFLRLFAKQNDMSLAIDMVIAAITPAEGVRTECDIALNRTAADDKIIFYPDAVEANAFTGRSDGLLFFEYGDLIELKITYGASYRNDEGMPLIEIESGSTDPDAAGFEAGIYRAENLNCFITQRADLLFRGASLKE